MDENNRNAQKLKTVFFGTPQVAVPFLELANSISEVLLVVTQPDRPSGRGMEVKPCPVKARALELGLNVLSPQIFKDTVPQIAELKADLGIAVAYGKIFRKPALEAFKNGILNVHFSLLPKYRGAAPMQHTLFNGEKESGVSVFWIDEGLDSGPLALKQQQIPLEENEDALSLLTKLTAQGKEALSKVITNLERGQIDKIPQTGEASTAPMIEKAQAFVSFKDMDAQKIHNITRALSAAMPCYARALDESGAQIQLLKTEHDPRPSAAAQKSAQNAGSLISIESNGDCLVQCKEGILRLKQIRPAGARTMTAREYVNGRKLGKGSVMFR